MKPSLRWQVVSSRFGQHPLSTPGLQPLLSGVTGRKTLRCVGLLLRVCAMLFSKTQQPSLQSIEPQCC